MVGLILPFAGLVIPEGFLLCDGSLVSRTTYDALFYEIGTTYGAGDGSTTFGLPNLNGRVPLGTAAGMPVGSSGGEETHSLLDTELPAHDHGIPSHGHGNDIQATTPVLSHTVGQAVFKYDTYGGGNDGTVAAAQSKWAYYNWYNNRSMTRSTNFAVAAHSAANCTMSGSVENSDPFDTGTAGLGNAHDNMMPFAVARYIIQAEPDTPPVPSMALIHDGTVIPVTAGGAYIAGRK